MHCSCEKYFRASFVDDQATLEIVKCCVVE